MALFAQPNRVEIEYTTNDKGIPELTTCRVSVTELSPRTFNINLLRKPPEERERLVKLFQHYSGELNPATKSPVMVNGREGQTDQGIVFFVMSDAQVIPVSLDYAIEQQAFLDSLKSSGSADVDAPNFASQASSISTVNPVKELDPEPEQQKPAASPLFKTSASK